MTLFKLHALAVVEMWSFNVRQETNMKAELLIDSFKVI